MRHYRAPKLAVGDRVAYSVQFLASIGMKHSEMARARGTVTELKTFGNSTSGTILAAIAWEQGDEMPGRVNTFNLAKVGANARFCNVD